MARTAAQLFQVTDTFANGGFTPTPLVEDFATRLQRLMADAPGAVSVYSGYRSNAKQKQLYEEAIRKYGRADIPGHQVARPGSSQHNFALAVDLKYGDSKTRAWVLANAKNYGVHFPVKGEPWHAEPVEARSSRGGAGSSTQRLPTSSSPSGLIAPGNINLNNRPVVRNADGSVSTVRSISVSADGKTYLIPTVVGGKVVSNAEAIKAFQRSGQHLGVFKDRASADTYARSLHEDQAARYAPKGFDKVEQILATIRKRESGGDYTVTSRIGGTASGAYQFVDDTWQRAAKAAGVDTRRYPKAKLAPPEVQDAVARKEVQRILDANNGDIRAVPAYWFYPAGAKAALAGKDVQPPTPKGGKGRNPTMLSYIDGWMKDFAKTTGTPTAPQSLRAAGVEEPGYRGGTNILRTGLSSMPFPSFDPADIPMPAPAPQADGLAAQQAMLLAAMIANPRRSM